MLILWANTSIPIQDAGFMIIDLAYILVAFVIILLGWMTFAMPPDSGFKALKDESEDQKAHQRLEKDWKKKALVADEKYTAELNYWDERFKKHTGLLYLPWEPEPIKVTSWRNWKLYGPNAPYFSDYVYNPKTGDYDLVFDHKKYYEYARTERKFGR